MGRTACSHFLIICIETTGIVCFSVCGEELGDLGIYFVTVICASFLCHTDTAVGLQGSLERSVCLETYDSFFALVKVTRAVGSNGGNNLGVHIQYTACFTFFFGKIQYHFP